MHRDRAACCTAPSGPAAGASTRGAARTTAATWSRCTSPRSACAAATAARASGSTSAARPRCPGLYAAGDMACVPHNYLLGALTYGKICARERAATTSASVERRPALDERLRSPSERARVFAPLARPNGIPHHQYRVQGAAPGQRLPAAAQERALAWSRAWSTSCARREELEELGRRRARTS